MVGQRSASICRRSVGRAVLMLSAVLGVLLGAWRGGDAHVASRAEWHPLAAAHLFGEFASTLVPIDWEGIEERFATAPSKFTHAGTEPAYAILERLKGYAGRDPGAAIRSAVEARDARGLRVALARATSIAVRERLARAKAKLDRPRAALRDTLSARSIFRAFEDALRDHDPETYRRFGLAWLDLTTRLGKGDDGAGAAIEGLSAEVSATVERGAAALLPRQKPLTIQRAHHAS